MGPVGVEGTVSEVVLVLVVGVSEREEDEAGRPSDPAREEGRDGGGVVGLPIEAAVEASNSALVSPISKRYFANDIWIEAS